MRATKRQTEAIRAYVEDQAHEEVVHLEKAASELVGPVQHDIWDVHCTDSRWWVITEPTNLYSQDDFKSRDVALTFHIGLALRVSYLRERKVAVNPGPAYLQCRTAATETRPGSGSLGHTPGWLTRAATGCTRNPLVSSATAKRYTSRTCAWSGSAGPGWPSPCTTPDGRRSCTCWSTRRSGMAARSPGPAAGSPPARSARPAGSRTVPSRWASAAGPVRRAARFTTGT